MASDLVINSTDASFQQDVLNSSIPVLVDFWAPWCGPCRMIAPILDEIAAERKDTLRVVKVNIDDNQSVAGSFGITSIPNLLVFKNGEVRAQIVGAQPKQAILSKIDSI